LIEQPLALTIEQAQHLIEAARRRLVLTVCRYYVKELRAHLLRGTDAAVLIFHRLVLAREIC
jgi:hypothetical protein